MKYVVYALRAASLGMLGLTVLHPENLYAVLLAMTFLATAAYEALYAYSLKHPTIVFDTKVLIEKVESLERDFAETKNKISALSMAASIKPQVNKLPFSRL